MPQFPPSISDTWAPNAYPDGVADPQDLDDASLAAAQFLCAAGGDLATGAGCLAAVRAYNLPTRGRVPEADHLCDGANEREADQIDPLIAERA